MTKREKLMVFGLLIVLILVGGYSFIIEPVMTKNSELNSQLSSTEMTYALTVAEVASLPDLQEEYTMSEAELATLLAGLDAYCDEEELDRMLMAEAEAAGLTISSLSLSDYTGTTQVDGQTGDALLMAKQFTVTLTGTSAQGVTIVASLQEMTDLVITNFSQSIGAVDEDDETSVVTDETTTTITGLVYMQVPNA